MISLKRKQSGFTIVELLIVIVVIGILAAIIITTFTGVQKKGRDADRKSDINAMYSQIEVYFAENSKYPTLANLQDKAFRDANMKGLSNDAVTAPGTNPAPDAGTLVASGPAINNYQYVVTADGGAACTEAAGDCAEFTLTATLENGGTFVKSGSNN